MTRPKLRECRKVVVEREKGEEDVVGEIAIRRDREDISAREENIMAGRYTMSHQQNLVCIHQSPKSQVPSPLASFFFRLLFHQSMRPYHPGWVPTVSLAKQRLFVGDTGPRNVDTPLAPSPAQVAAAASSTEQRQRLEEELRRTEEVHTHNDNVVGEGSEPQSAFVSGEVLLPKGQSLQEAYDALSLSSSSSLQQLPSSPPPHASSILSSSASTSSSLSPLSPDRALHSHSHNSELVVVAPLSLHDDDDDSLPAAAAVAKEPKRRRMLDTFVEELRHKHEQTSPSMSMSMSVGESAEAPLLPSPLVIEGAAAAADTKRGSHPRVNDFAQSCNLFVGNVPPRVRTFCGFSHHSLLLLSSS